MVEHIRPDGARWEVNTLFALRLGEACQRRRHVQEVGGDLMPVGPTGFPCGSGEAGG